MMWHYLQLPCIENKKNGHNLKRLFSQFSLLNLETQAILKSFPFIILIAEALLYLITLLRCQTEYVQQIKTLSSLPHTYVTLWRWIRDLVNL